MAVEIVDFDHFYVEDLRVTLKRNDKQVVLFNAACGSTRGVLDLTIADGIDVDAVCGPLTGFIPPVSGNLSSFFEESEER